MSSETDFTPASLVLVTGANGHVAQHVLSQLLARPAAQRPRIRASVRSASSAKALEMLFSEHTTAGALELIQVPDISVPGAFDAAVLGVTHVAHIASPIAVGAADVANDLLKPAIQGTSSVLSSCLKSPSIKAVVVTSSFAAVMDPSHGARRGYTYTPADWNPTTYEEAASPSLDLTKFPPTYAGFVTYMASKKLAEKAAWDLHAQHSPTWSLATVCPTYIGGPVLLPLTKGADSLSFSNKLLWGVASSKPGDALPVVDFPNWVDVRDVARAHVEALRKGQAAHGQRFVLAPYKTSYTTIADAVRKIVPSLTPSEERQVLDIFDIESSNCQDVLGITEWQKFEDMVGETVKQTMAAVSAK